MDQAEAAGVGLQNVLAQANAGIVLLFGPRRGMDVITARARYKENRTMHPITLEQSLSLPKQTPLIETPAPLACLYCAATRASVRPQREIIDARMVYSAECVCCDCETGNACPHCLTENLEYEATTSAATRRLAIPIPVSVTAAAIAGPQVMRRTPPRRL